MADYGARTPSAQGNYGKYGAVTPGTNASPQSVYSTLQSPSTRRSTAMYDDETKAGESPAGGGTAPPSLQTPSVNRDGSIPDPAPPPSAAPRQTYGGSGGPAPAPSYGGGGGYAVPQIGPLASDEWKNYVLGNLAPRGLSQENLTPYQGATVAAYQDPTNPQMVQAHNDLMMRVLQNPESLPPQVVAAMKEQQKESALALRQQLMSGNNQNAISRGVLGGGYQQAQARNIGDQAAGDITKAYRDIDIAAAQQNFNDRLSALASADAMQSGVTQRAMGNYQTGLAGQDFNANQRFLENQGTNDRTRFGYQRTLDEANLQNQAVQNALSAWNTETQSNLARAGLQLDYDRFAGSPLDWAQFGEGQYMGRLNYGLNLADLQQRGQRDLMNFLPRG